MMNSFFFSVVSNPIEAPEEVEAVQPVMQFKILKKKPAECKYFAERLGLNTNIDKSLLAMFFF